MLKRLFLIPLVSFLARHPRWGLFGLLLYLVLPFDALPEGLTGVVGYLDDLIVLLAGLVLAGHLRKKRGKRKEEIVVDTTAEILREKPSGLKKGGGG